MARMYKSTRRRSREEEREDETADRKTVVYEWEEVAVKDGSRRAMDGDDTAHTGGLVAGTHTQTGRQVRYWLRLRL